MTTATIEARRKRHKAAVSRSRHADERNIVAVLPVLGSGHDTRKPWPSPRIALDRLTVCALYDDMIPNEGVASGEATGSHWARLCSLHKAGVTRSGKIAVGGATKERAPFLKDLLEALTERGERFHLSERNRVTDYALQMDREIADAAKKHRPLDSQPPLPQFLLGFEQAPSMEVADVEQLRNYSVALLNKYSFGPKGFVDSADTEVRSDTSGVISAFEQTKEVGTVIRLADAETSEHDVTEALGKIGPGFSVYSAEILLPDSFEPLADLDIGCRITEGQVLGYDDQLAEVPKRQYADWNAVTAANVFADDLEARLLAAAWAKAQVGGEKFAMTGGKDHSTGQLEYFDDGMVWMDFRLFAPEHIVPGMPIVGDFSDLLLPGGVMPVLLFKRQQQGTTSLKFSDITGKVMLDLLSCAPSRLPFRNVEVAKRRGIESKKSMEEQCQNLFQGQAEVTSD